MNPIAYYEDPQKLKSGTIKLTLIAAACTLLGLMILMGSTGYGTRAYVEGGLGGGLIGGGGCGLFLCIQMFGRLGKPPRVLIGADESGIEIAVTPTFSNHIPWSNVQEITAQKKGLSNFVLVHLKDTEAYISSLSTKDAKAAKINQKTYQTPAVVVLNYCVSGAEQIANELNASMQMAVSA